MSSDYVSFIEAYNGDNKSNLSFLKQIVGGVILFIFFMVLFSSVRKPQYINMIYPWIVFVVFLSYVFQGEVVSGIYTVFSTFISVIGIVVSSSMINRVVIFSSMMLFWFVYFILTRYKNEMVVLCGSYEEENENLDLEAGKVYAESQECRNKISAATQLIFNYERMVSYLQRSASNVFMGVDGFLKSISSSGYFGEDVKIDFVNKEECLRRAPWIEVHINDNEFFVSPDSRVIFSRFILPHFSCNNSKDVVHYPSVYFDYEWGVFEKKSGVFSDDDKRFIAIAADFARAAVSNIILYQETEKLSIVDGLTGLYLRGYFMERFREEFELSSSYKFPLSVLMIDIDDFKNLNDKYGHHIGDEALRMVSHLLKNRLRETDVVGRYGGEEFVAALPHTTHRDALTIAEDLRRTISKEKIFVGSQEATVKRTVETVHRYVTLTVSIGTAERMPADASITDLISRADKKLYGAKRAGKNRVA